MADLMERSVGETYLSNTPDAVITRMSGRVGLIFTKMFLESELNSQLMNSEHEPLFEFVELEDGNGA